MGNPKGFLKVKRETGFYRPACERVKDYQEVIEPRPEWRSREQASRCMDCGTPFCHWGCPIGNYIPEWNDLVFSGQWKRAFELLDATNILPEVTGRICPAVCEFACVLGINDDPVTIRENEQSIIEYAFKQGWVKPRLPAERTGKKVAVVGSGPAGLACAVELNRAGHSVTVFEREDKIGGIMRYGIPDFKLEKSLLDRRIEIWKEEGVRFLTGTNAGIDLSVEKLKSEFQALVVAGGSRVPRDLKLEGRELQGIHFAMEYLVQSNRRVVGEKIPPKELIDAGGKKVVVIGGGDTGADCVGTAHRQGAACVVQIELLPQPPQKRSPQQAWPSYPFIFKSSTSHEEGGERRWSIATKKFLGKDGKIGKLACIKVDEKLNEIAGSDFEIEADLVILALGFLHPERSGLLEKLRLEHDARGNVKTDGNYMTSEKGIFSAGDMRRGQSLIVWALAEGQQAAKYIDQYLIGSSSLITK